MIETPKGVIEKWMEAINHGNIEALVGLYDTKAVLIPTFSNRLLNSKEKILEYFEKLAKREELRVTIHEKTLQIQHIKNEIFVASGIYTWHFAIDGETFIFEARFTYVIDISNPNPILHHHSSQIPRTL
ncbi:MAG TPA: DUF4440 domain-containing protein [Victivallales bacterium]|nr:DUF4440 domain-containing protein [Victivallales bacterium]HRR28300.1 DUF4440 domain-containing protein [Victivallales bacterium]